MYHVIFLLNIILVFFKPLNANNIQYKPTIFLTTSCESLHKDLNGICRSINNYYDYECDNAFDGDIMKTKWVGEYNEKNQMPQISFEFNSLRLVNQYILYAGNLSINLQYGWILAGSLDGGHGVLLDQRDNEVLSLSQRYYFTNTRRFKHYFLIFKSLPIPLNRIEIHELILCKTYQYEQIISNKVDNISDESTDSNQIQYKYKEYDNDNQDYIYHNHDIDINDIHNIENIDWNIYQHVEQSSLLSTIYPLPYSIPDELIVNEIPIKRHLWSEIIPGERLTYRFNDTEENEYHLMYQSSMFAITKKKDGWDSLRHYEILANGVIPVFTDINNCPNQTLITYPKELIKQAMFELLPWKTNNNIYELKYKYYLNKLLLHTKENCSTSSIAKYFLSKFNHKTGSTIKEIKNILLLTGHNGINYSRETLWIGLKRYISSIGGIAVEFPTMNYLYDNLNPMYKRYLYGYGYSYTMKLNSSLLIKYEESQLILSILNKYWDIIIYGRVGIDEDRDGSIPSLPYWSIVSKHYHKYQIAFIYGGDHQIDTNNVMNNKYLNHLQFHCQYAICFVRELV